MRATSGSSTPSAAPAEARRGALALLALVAGIVGLRVLALAYARTDLFVDEAQYWLWGRELAFGYYSKPPLIGWVIRAVTELAGSNAIFWVRLAAPLAHGATALILAQIAAETAGRRAALWVALGYLTLPMVAVGSAVISTDTIMLPFLALALWAWRRALLADGRRRLGLAALAGLGIGLGAMAKYAALYYLAGAGLAAALWRAARPGWRAAGLALAVMLLCLMPNILWNALHGWPTLQHTADNISWVEDPDDRAGLHFGALLTFLGGQFLVFGPLSFAVFLALAAAWGERDASDRLWLAAGLPILALVAGQALLAYAYANWAVAAYLPASLVTFAWAARRPRFGALAVAANAALCLALIAATLRPADLVLPSGRPLLARYLGHAAVSEQILAAARARGLGVVVADGRELLADLFYTGRHSGLRFYAALPKACDADDDCFHDQYQMTHPVLAELPGPALFASYAGPPPCPAAPLGQLAPVPGTWQKGPIGLWQVGPDCWAAEGAHRTP